MTGHKLHSRHLKTRPVWPRHRRYLRRLDFLFRMLDTRASELGARFDKAGVEFILGKTVTPKKEV